MGDVPTTLHTPKKEDELDYCLDMPPGFRFHPTDAEIILSYLLEKVKDHSFTSVAIGEIDLNSCEPWDLPRRAKMGEKEWWFFWHRDRKYPTGTRTNRATESGYWKATGKDKEIYKGKGCLVGMKKTLVFYLGRAPKGGKTNWVMHEYRLEGKSLHNHISRSSKNDWVVCRVFHKNEPKKNVEGEVSRSNCLSLNTSYGVDRSTLPPLSESSPTYTDNMSMPSSSFAPDLSISTASWMPTYPNINPFFLDIPLMPTINPNPTNYYDLPPPTQFAPFREQGDVEYLHHDHVETRDALKGKCKIEEHPLPSRSTVETGGRTWDDPGSPSCSVGPLANLDKYLWSN